MISLLVSDFQKSVWSVPFISVAVLAKTTHPTNTLAVLSFQLDFQYFTVRARTVYQLLLNDGEDIGIRGAIQNFSQAIPRLIEGHLKEKVLIL